ncbi:response regulator [Cesiribacter sp. SM1]|uniref:response regulator n=1 Tax=Cesiribacter sp. SM1 TaxID=2861196 RepID=UPI001CD3D366|nr:response regulator [Cesiribacter sp. SM1]
MSKKTILLIDDDTLFLMLTRKMLEGQDYLGRIDTATTVEEARQYFQNLKENNSSFPDAVFIDLDMPMVSGLEMAQQLKDTFLAEHPQTKIFILSSSISQRDRQTAESLEAVTDYMEKPLSPEVLKQALTLEQKSTGDRKSMSANRNTEPEEKIRKQD